MASRAELRARLTLNNNPFLKGMSASVAAARGLGRAVVSIGNSAMGTFMRGAVAATAAVGLLTVGIAKAVDKAAEMETLTTSFEVMLGSATKAAERMRVIEKFAAETPFELPEVARASRVLETLTKGALSTGKGLTLVGDAASAVNEPFDELAMWVGRLYDGLQSGRPVGEALMRLGELGLVASDTRNKLEDMQKAGMKGDAVWQVAAQALGRFSGMMQKQSKTWSGLMSTFQDSVSGAMRSFGQPIMDRLKPFLAEMITTVDGMRGTFAKLGDAVADKLQKAIPIAKALMASFSNPQAMFGAAIDFLMSGMALVGDVLLNSFQAALQGFAKGGAEIIAGMGQGLIASLLRAFREPLIAFQAGLATAMETAMLGGEKLWNSLKAIALGFGEGLGEAMSAVVDRMEVFGQALGALLKGDLNGAGEKMRYMDLMPSAGEVMGYNMRDRWAEAQRTNAALPNENVGDVFEDYKRRIAEDGGPQFGLPGAQGNANQWFNESQKTIQQGMVKFRAELGKFQARDYFGAGNFAKSGLNKLGVGGTNPFSIKGAGGPGGAPAMTWDQMLNGGNGYRALNTFSGFRAPDTRARMEAQQAATRAGLRARGGALSSPQGYDYRRSRTLEERRAEKAKKEGKDPVDDKLSTTNSTLGKMLNTMQEAWGTGTAT